MESPMKLRSAAAALGITEYALRVGARRGTIPAIKMGGNYLFYIDQVQEILRAEALKNVTAKINMKDE